MKRLGLAVAAIVAMVVVAPAVASAETISPMCTTAQGTSQCASGWYPTPVFELSWVWTPGGTPTNCNQHAFQSDTVSTVSCTVAWPNGVGSQSYTVHVETSSPTATVTPSRRPDSGGWYNHPVGGIVRASSFSGIASCAPPRYSGPSSAAARLSATCVDNAGKRVTALSAPFPFDVTPPSISAAASAGDRRVALSWHTGGVAPTVAVRVRRRRAGARAATVYRGDGGGFVDTHVRNGVRYTYTITARDRAGNRSSTRVVVIPGPRLLGPPSGAHVRTPPMLSWTPVRGATYYNVQLYRHGKVLSLWPTHAGLQLRRTWKFDGHRYHLRPGRYHWFVWPGFGRRSAGSYGPVIGRGTFIVVR